MTAIVLMLALQVPSMCKDPADEFRQEVCDWIDTQERRREIALAVDAELAAEHAEKESQANLVNGLITGGGSVGGVLGLLALLHQAGIITLRKKT